MDEIKLKRSLILAGGGLKVAFQAGVLQVWLDEAGLTFQHADGASGGVFNLAMYCQGMSGTQIANNWRDLSPMLFVDLNWQQYFKLPYAESILKLDAFRKHIFPRWGIDWEMLRASPHEATFNVYNYSKHELVALTPDRMSEDLLIACVSLPMWFPPVIIDEEVHIDSVYITDANIEEAIRRGADELWIIWTVSEKSQWHPGFVANYFQIVETAANGHFRRILQRIEANNRAVAEGRVGEFGRPIELKILRAEVPLHYLINLSADRINEAVNLGVQMARTWCKEQGIPLKAVQQEEVPALTVLSFSEEMKGYVTFGEQDYRQGLQQGQASGNALTAHLTIKICDVHRFVIDPAHEAIAEGCIVCESLGGKLAIEKGTFNLFVDNGDPTHKKMLYRLFFRDAVGHALTLSGFKSIREQVDDTPWHATTTLFIRVLQGHLEEAEEAEGQTVLAGIISIHMLDFLHQLTTMRVEGTTVEERTVTLIEFGTFFLGKLWDVYGQKILSYGPF